MSIDLQAAKSATLATSAYERLRQDIVNGVLPPGGKLRIETICERYDVGASPVREALNRLSSEGLVSHHDQRGFGVLPVSSDDLLELTRTRCWLYEITLRESLARGDQAWEDHVVLAGHRLRRTSRDMAKKSGDLNPEWEKNHRAFHMALISACGSRWLLGLSGTLFDLSDRYRHLANVAAISGKTSGGRRDPEREHQEMLETALDRDVEKLVKLATEHVTRTTEAVLANGALLPATAKSVDKGASSKGRRSRNGAMR